MIHLHLHGGNYNEQETQKFRSSHPEAFSGKGVLKIGSKFTGEHPCRSMIKMFIEITLRHGCSPVNLLHIFRTLLPKNTSWWLLLKIKSKCIVGHLILLQQQPRSTSPVKTYQTGMHHVVNGPYQTSIEQICICGSEHTKVGKIGYNLMQIATSSC